MMFDTQAPLLGTFDPTVLKKRHNYRETCFKEVQNSIISQKMIYPYDFLLDRLFKQFPQNHSITKHQSISIPSAVLKKLAKKTTIVNFNNICQAIHREPALFKEYLCTEINSTGNTAPDGSLTLNTRLQVQTFEKILVNFLYMYIKCPTCGSLNTIPSQHDRLQFIKCNDCNAETCVQRYNSQNVFKADTSKRKTRK